MEEQPPEGNAAALAALATALVAASGGAPGGTAGRGVAGVASALLALMPAALVRNGASDDVARQIARLISRDVPVIEGSTGIMRRARIEQLLFRAAYGGAASRRVLARIVGTDRREESIREAFGGALETERGYFEKHVSVNSKRETGARRVVDAMELYGEVLSWNTTIRPTNRPNHRGAHERNWLPLAGPPVETGAYPGVLDFCLCFPGPPRPGAPMLR